MHGEDMEAVYQLQRADDRLNCNTCVMVTLLVLTWTLTIVIIFTIVYLINDRAVAVASP